MIKDRKIIILSSVLAVLILVYILGSIYTRSEKELKAHVVALMTPFELQKAAALEINRSGKIIRMDKGEDGSWLITGGEIVFPAADDKIERFFETLINTKTNRFVTGKKDLFTDFGLGNGKNYYLILDDEGGIVRRILLAEPEGTEGIGYIRLQPEEKIYEVDNDVFFYNNQDRNYWADLSILPEALSPDSIIRAGFEADLTVDEEYSVRDRYTLVRTLEDEDETWIILPENREADSSTAENILASIAGLTAEAFAVDQDPEGKGFEEPAVEISLETVTGYEYALIVGNPVPQQEERYYLKVSGIPYIYELNSWSIRRILRSKQDLLSPEQE